MCARGMSWAPSGADATVSLWIQGKVVASIRFGSPYLEANFVIVNQYDPGQPLELTVGEYANYGPLGVVKLDIR